MHKTVRVGAIIDHEDHILIVHDGKSGWRLPGSELGEGETPWDTLLREVWEETNILIKDSNVNINYNGSHPLLRNEEDIHIFNITMPKDWESPTLKNYKSKQLNYKWVHPLDYSKYLSPRLYKLIEELQND